MPSSVLKSRNPLFAGAMIAVICAGCLVAPSRAAEKAKLLHAGDVLSGGLTALRSGPKKARTIVYQLTSEPRRLPPPSGMCDLETGPETFQIVTSSDAEVSALKPFIGKNVSIKANEMSCAQAAGQMSDAIVTKWSVVNQ
ncbi:MAG: hypothetical protein K2X60_11530 [Xanthobacteraceae bacterium]|nr:hypothetical protein [Xanthobacteraceae bacterium]